MSGPVMPCRRSRFETTFKLCSNVGDVDIGCTLGGMGIGFDFSKGMALGLQDQFKNNGFFYLLPTRNIDIEFIYVVVVGPSSMATKHDFDDFYHEARKANYLTVR